MRNKAIGLTLLFCLLSGLSLFAQTGFNYTGTLSSQGAFPSHLSKIVRQQKHGIDERFVQEMVTEGKILYGTPLNDYLNTILDNLLADNAALRSQLHLYILKETEVNACITGDGTIFVNMGLIAQVSNESELAYIIAHELSHYTEHHIRELSAYKKSLKRKDAVQYYVNYFQRSREQELAADKIALTGFYKNSPYSFDALNGTFDVLQYADLPFDEVPFRREMVETSFFTFPDNYFLNNVNPITSSENRVDTLQTHPNIGKRRAVAQALVAGESNSGRQLNVQSESLFRQVRHTARMECIALYLVQHSYDQALYNTFVLLQETPEDPILQEYIVSALYGYAKHKNNSTSVDCLRKYKEVEGEMQQVCYFLSKLTRQEASVLALRAAWKALQQHPGNNYLSDIVTSCMQDIFVKQKMQYVDFSDYPMGTDLSTIPEETPAVAAPSTGKYQRIKSQTLPDKVRPTEKFKTVNYMLVDIHRDSLFFARMSQVINISGDEAVLEFVKQSRPASDRALIVASPVVRLHTVLPSTAARKQYDKIQSGLARNVARSIRKLKLDAVQFTGKELSQFTTEQYNGYCELQQWKEDFYNGNGSSMVYVTSKRMNAAFDLTQTTKVCILNVKRAPDNFMNFFKVENLMLAGVCPYGIPAALVSLALPRYSTEANFNIVDFASGNTILSHHFSQSSVMSNAYLNAFIYDNLYEFVKGKGK